MYWYITPRFFQKAVPAEGISEVQAPGSGSPVLRADSALWDTARAYDEVLNQVLVCSRNPPDQAPKDWQAVSVDDARIFFEQVKGRPSKTHEIADEEDMLLAQMAIRAKNR